MHRGLCIYMCAATQSRRFCITLQYIAVSHSASHSWVRRDSYILQCDAECCDLVLKAYVLHLHVWRDSLLYARGTISQLWLYVWSATHCHTLQQCVCVSEYDDMYVVCSWHHFSIMMICMIILILSFLFLGFTITYFIIIMILYLFCLQYHLLCMTWSRHKLTWLYSLCMHSSFVMWSS